jgi:LysR family transcriptional regulator, glycine cleavage system transcriptional activator
MRRLPPLTALEAFIQVARTGSVKAAAAELALSTPALSRRVQALERYLGLTLFDRKHQHMELNPDGQKLMAEIAPVLDALGIAIDSVLKGRRELRLRLGVLPLFASQRLLPRMGELRRLHPDFHVDIDTSPLALARLGDSLDAAIILTREIDPTLYAKELGRDEIYLIAPLERTEGPAAIRTPADLARETILVHREMPDLFEDWSRAIGLPDLEPRDVQQYDSGQLILEAVAQGFGIAVMFEQHFESAHDPRLARLFAQQVESPYRYFFVCRQRAMENKAVRIFHDWLFSSEI